MKKSICCFLFSLFLASPRLMAQHVKAEIFATEAAKRLMQSICPNTGNNPIAYVYDWDYAPGSGHYKIKFSASWHARKCWMCEGESLYEITGYLDVDQDGKAPVFIEISRNEAVRDACSNRELGNVVATGSMLSGASGNKN